MIGEDSVAVLSFRAGRMLQKGTSVAPDSRKGEVTLYQTVMHSLSCKNYRPGDSIRIVVSDSDLLF